MQSFCYHFSFEWNKTLTNRKCNIVRSIVQCFMCGSSAGRAFLRYICIVFRCIYTLWGTSAYCYIFSFEKITLFQRFPLESKMRMKWLENLNIMNALPSSGMNMFLCDIHFRNEDITFNLETERKEIKPESVPVK